MDAGAANVAMQTCADLLVVERTGSAGAILGDNPSQPPGGGAAGFLPDPLRGPFIPSFELKRREEFLDARQFAAILVPAFGKDRRSARCRS